MRQDNATTIFNWEWQQEIGKIRYVFPQVAELLTEYRSRPSVLENFLSEIA